MTQHDIFIDRYDAGRQLAKALHNFIDRDDILVAGLPRGGIPVAYEVALALNSPLEVFVVRKLGVPSREEMALGAIATGNVRFINQDIVDMFQLDEHSIARIEAREQQELQRREKLYRGNLSQAQFTDKTVILIDDGLATGATMKAAVKALQTYNPAHIVIAVPVASPETCAEFQDMQAISTTICLRTPENFRAVGLWYVNFEQTGDEEVSNLLKKARERYTSG